MEETGLAEAPHRVVTEPELDLLIFDFDPSIGEGPELIRRLRSASSAPILTMSDSEDEPTVISALDSGADASLRKPFSKEELLARVSTALRWHAWQKGKPTRIATGGLEIDLLHRSVGLNGRAVRLPRKLYDVLRVLAEAAGRVLTHEEILRAVWGSRRVNRRQYLRVAIRNLRHRLEPDPNHPRYILTETHIGYRLEVQERSRHGAPT